MTSRRLPNATDLNFCLIALRVIAEVLPPSVMRDR